MNSIKSYISKYEHYFSNRRFIGEVLVAFGLLLISLVVNFYAGVYATEKASNFVSDIILSNIRVFDVDTIFVWGPVVFWAYIAILCLKEPRRIPFVLKSIALFVLIRSVFISMTHIGPFPDHLVLTSNTRMVKDFTFGGDLFFSAHTGLPFLMAMVFYKNVRLRVLFMLTAVFFGIIVLLAHRHYSIDVLSAFFITYAIFHIAEIFFKWDLRVFDEGLPMVKS